MFMPQRWITEILDYANPGWSVTPEELDSAYVRVGFETEGYETIPETTGPLVLGRVEKIEELEGFKKPIRYCDVNVGKANGSGELQHIICGARNFAEGDIVVVALPGTVLPGDFSISARKTYGKMSEGMLCSAMELGLSRTQDKGIITLPAKAGQPGDDPRLFLRLSGTIFDVNITPDRGYALSARGLAREIASSFNLAYVDPADEPAAAELRVQVPDVSGDAIPVDVRNTTDVKRFGIREVRGIDPSAATPFWMERQLMLCGQRPVNLPTDVTNYVMFLYGQPMHAFDADKIKGGLTVRDAQQGETLTTLDGAERNLDPEDLVIADETGIQSMAGVMGGSTSEIGDSTTSVYLEAASFDAMTIARTSRRHKLSSEASRRFERGVDPALVEVALDTAAALIAGIAGGEIASGRTLIGDVPTMPTIQMDDDYPSQMAGVDYPRGTAEKRLKEIGCAVIQSEEVEDEAPLLSVTPPTWRPDLTMKADLVEEVLRLEGIEDIPSVVPQSPAGRGLTLRQRRRRAVGHALAWSGYTETLPSPFIADDTFDVWGLEKNDPRRNVVKVLNPLESGHSSLGTTLLPSLLESLKRNIDRGQADVSLYGVEQVSFDEGNGPSPMLDVSARPSEYEVHALIHSLPSQPLHVGTVSSGLWTSNGPWGAGRPVDTMDAIESVRVVGRAVGINFEFVNVEHLPWHPGRCAGVFLQGSPNYEPESAIGFAGELHPQVCERLGIPPRTVASELDLDAIPFVREAVSPQLSPFPAVLQDVAVVVDNSVPAEKLRRSLMTGAGELLESIELFDIYRSEALGENKVSMTFALKFRASDRTLTEEECNEARQAAVAHANEELGATLRG